MGGRGSTSRIRRGFSGGTDEDFRRIGIRVHDVRGRDPIMPGDMSKRDTREFRAKALHDINQMQKEFGSIGVTDIWLNDRRQDVKTALGTPSAAYSTGKEIHFGSGRMTRDVVYHEAAHSLLASIEGNYHQRHEKDYENALLKQISEFEKKNHRSPTQRYLSNWSRNNKGTRDFQTALLSRARQKAQYTKADLASPFGGTTRYGYRGGTKERLAEGIADYMTNGQKARPESQSIARELKSYLRGEWQ